MATFTVRVELLDKPDPQAFARLHAAMEREGFERTVVEANTRAAFRLPSGEYNFVAEMTTQKVLKRACRAANESGRRFSVLVTESVGRTWLNLGEV
ncbi:hypothetical protein TA3x_001663 [Tundrisphaera sp. TA3]|uniref:hypothetical protein n=1 Tax=Tundrisphaera sp. TA3 TaxID=3435775 RepID=UPI003EBB8D78